MGGNEGTRVVVQLLEYLASLSSKNIVGKDTAV